MNDPTQKYTLTIVDTTGIQEYIFGSNSLRHNVGASWLVHWATNDAVFTELVALEGRVKTNIDEMGHIYDSRQIESRQISSELLYAGGGNALLIFQTHALAVEFTKRLTNRVLVTAPGLQLVVTHHQINWHQDTLANQVDYLRTLANQKKSNRRHSMPLLGLSVTADCQYSGLPAVMIDVRDENRRVSAAVKAKIDHFPAADRRLRNEVGAARRADLEFAYDFNQIGTPDQSSYLAVVHIDGNGMGARFEGIAATHQSPMQNRAYVEAIRRLSSRIKTIAREALQNTVVELQHAVTIEKKQENTEGKGQALIADKVPIHQNRLPFRPIVYGGDDVTFVCDGRLGLTLAAFYLQQMEQSLATTGDAMGKDILYVRAGIAVVNNHYPFARSYKLAEDLAQSAKQFITSVAPAKTVSALDWHFAVNGLAQDLAELRQRDYRTHDGSLLIRPLLLHDYEDLPGPEGPATSWRTWPFFRDMTENFLENQAWGDRRSKAKAYGAALRAGPPAAQQFLKAFLPSDIYLPTPPGEPDVATCGWQRGERCVHFDAIEAMDFFVPLLATSEGGNS
ncbi:MAG: hypothetical protein R3E79_02805 [Caldilineaceae bacterium]